MEIIIGIVVVLGGMFVWEYMKAGGGVSKTLNSSKWFDDYRKTVGSYFGMSEEESVNSERFEGNVSFKDTPMEVGLRLPKNEYVLEYFDNMTLYKYKSDGRVKGHGVTARIRIAKGIYYRAGAGRIGMNKSWQPDARGTLYITNKGILFDGDVRNVKLPWSKIIREEISDNSLQFEKQTGDPLVFGDDIDPVKAGRLNIIAQMHDAITDDIANGEYPPK